MSRRVYCAGTEARPCPAHAYWFYEGTGRPRERCPVCWLEHETERRAENRANAEFKRRVVEGAWVSRGEGAQRG
jgi:hypothetical protein